MTSTKRRRHSVSGQAAGRHAKKAAAYGVMFHSVKERDYYCQLLLRERAGEVRNIVRQPRFQLEVGGTPLYLFPRVKGARPVEYRADFAFEERDRSSGEWVATVVETKGVWSEYARLKVAIAIANGLNLKVI